MKYCECCGKELKNKKDVHEYGHLTLCKTCKNKVERDPELLDRLLI